MARSPGLRQKLCTLTLGAKHKSQKNLLGRDCIFVPTGVRKANASLKNKLVNQYHNISITMHPCV